MMVVLFLLVSFTSMRSPGQHRQTSAATVVPVVMLSDIHFDPFHDPEKVPLLDRSPVTAWRGILDAPESRHQHARFEAVQNACSGKDGVDTPYALLRSSLSAAAQRASSAAFATFSGDLLVHDLDCRYRSAMGMPASTVDDQSASVAFAEKTTAFVMQEVEATFPRVPVYFALGNNDSRCNHNRLDSHDDYLRASASTLVDGLRGATDAEKAAASTTYQSAGYYAVTLPAPMKSARLLVIDDIYMMPKFASCKGSMKDRTSEQEQIAWLQRELNDARERHQRVWMLGHLPPAVNPDASLSAPGPFCDNGKTVRFQMTETLADQIESYADVIKLGIFGHTHMDELHLLRGKSGAVPIKVVASVTPVSGNLPSFTVASVDPGEAKITDFTIYSGSNTMGIAENWTREYSFDAAYNEPDFSSPSLANLIARLRADTAGVSGESQSYRAHVLKGSSGKKLSPSWMGYVCSLDTASAEGFKSCVCAAH